MFEISCMFYLLVIQELLEYSTKSDMKKAAMITIAAFFISNYYFYLEPKSTGHTVL